MNIFEKIEKHNYSKKTYQNGAIGYQNVKSVFRGKELFIGEYLHTIYPGLNGNDIQVFLNETNIKIHHEYLDLLKQYNGFTLFSGSFELCGFGRTLVNGVYLTSRDPLNPLPIHLLDENNGRLVFEKMKIGAICDTCLYLNNDTGEIQRIGQNGDLIEKWQTLKECVENLFDRLEKHYDEEGICKTPYIANNIFINRVMNF